MKIFLEGNTGEPRLLMQPPGLIGLGGPGASEGEPPESARFARRAAVVDP